MSGAKDKQFFEELIKEFSEQNNGAQRSWKPFSSKQFPDKQFMGYNDSKVLLLFGAADSEAANVPLENIELWHSVK